MKTKKILAIIFVLVMLLSALSVAASADSEKVIEPYEAVEVTVSESMNAVLKFVPEETRTYWVKSYADEEIDPYCYIESEDGSVYESFDDFNNSYNFAAKIEFEAGVVYYITICSYSDEATFNVAIECVHKWNDDTCDDCKVVCDHDTTDKKFKTCDCGQVSLCKDIKVGETLTVAYEEGSSYVRFVATEDTTAMLRSYVDVDGSGYDACAYIYSSDGEELAYNDDFGGTMDFLIWYEFTEGETYFFEISSFYEDMDVVISLDPAVHTTEDGEEHALEYKYEEYGNCVEYCIYEGVYCEECGEYYIGGEPKEGTGSHYDGDEDGCCDYCGEEYVEEDYEEEETNGGILEFFYNMFLYIITIFRIIFAIIM